MSATNISILEKTFNWLIIDDLSKDQVKLISNKLKSPLDENFLFKCTWSHHKKCTVYSFNDNPLLFLKYVRDNFFQELLGLHLTTEIFDRELGFSKYIAGLLNKSKPIPYILTTYEEGEDIGNYEIDEFEFALGRQCYLHEILCLYDVFDRHLIVRNENLIFRIDFGRSFENVHKKYLGFSDYLHIKKLSSSNTDFQSGYSFEKKKIINNILAKKRSFFSLMREIKKLETDYKLIYIDINQFYTRLIDYWNEIGFLKDADLTEIK